MSREILKSLGEAFAKNQVIPFIGAGASFPHLHLDWDSLSRRMDARTGYSGGNKIISAQRFVETFGKAKFCGFLQECFEITEFQDDLGEIYLFLLTANCYYYYTTNQDNVFEKCFQKYNRRYRVISDIATFREASPNYPTIVRFHGDLRYPDMVVFTADDYQRRMLSAQQVSSLCPLDIRLLSDSISKTLVFLGYSFRDPNIEELFQHVDLLFGHNPPPSYLIMHRSDSAFAERMLDKYKIECIDPINCFPGQPEDIAYRMVLAELSRLSFEARSAADIVDLFDPGDFGIIPIALPFEIERFHDYLRSTADTATDKLSKFRAIFDGRNIPTSKIETVKDILVDIIRQVEKKEDYQQLIGAMMNLDHFDPANSIEILSEYFCALERVPVADSLDSIVLTNVHMRSVPSQYNVVAMARCFELLIGRGGHVAENILGHVSYGVQSRRDVDDLDEPTRKYVEGLFAQAYASSKSYSNPLARASLNLRTPRFEEIVSQMSSFFPKRPHGPKP